MSFSPKMRDGIRGVIGFVLLVMFGLFCWWGYWWFFTGSWNALRKHVPEYVDLTNPNPMLAPSPIKKFVIVDPRARDLDPLHYDLPRPLRAERPEEVTTIVQVRRLSSAVGVYTRGAGVAVKWTFEVRILDKASKLTLDERTFEGGDAPSSVRSRRGGWTSGEGDKPIGTVLYYLEDFAKRSSGK